MPKYANFEEIGSSDKTITYSESKNAKKAEKTEKVQINVPVRLKTPFGNKTIYELLPLLEVHTYDKDAVVKKLKEQIGDILRQLE